MYPTGRKNRLRLSSNLTAVVSGLSLIILLIMIITQGCAGSSPVKSSPDIIFTNASIWTASNDTARQEAIAISGEEIIAIGTTEEIMAFAGPQTKIIDLNGRFVVPGFIDSHTHFISGGQQLASVDLRGADSREEFTRRIQQYAATIPEGRWITGGDWDHERWGGELPHRDWIDDVTPNNPVLISRLDGHMALANSLALELAGIDEHTQDPEGGTIVRDENSKQPTGILKDDAMNPVYGAMPGSSESELDEALQRAVKHALSRGVTQICDMGSWSHLATFQRAVQAGFLNIRAYSFVPISTWESLNAYITKNGRGDDWHRWGGLKGFVDGSLGSTTAGSALLLTNISSAKNEYHLSSQT